MATALQIPKASKYWDINEILPYQRNFNLINGQRSIGKTYTTQIFTLNKAIKKGQQFVYIVRTQDEKEHGIMEKAFEKVVNNEFSNYSFDYSSDAMYIVEDGVKRVVGWCIALSEAQKIKKRSFPDVYYIIFDEYMLEAKSAIRYVMGWKEPDLFLSIYHTIDREEDRVKCFLLGNNTSFYNPYHMHKAFAVPQIERGKIWYSENVLFQWAVSTAELTEQKANSKFLRMIEPTQYGTYAAKGEYTEDAITFIEERTPKAKHVFYFEYMGNKYGVWYDSGEGKVFIDTKYDPNCKTVYALTLDDHSENTTLTAGKNITLLKWLANNFKQGNVKFVSMEVKKLSEHGITLLL